MEKSLGYDRLAASYQAIEWLAFGRQLQRARVALIDRLPVWHRLLIFGDGDGRLLEELYVRRRSSAQCSLSHWRSLPHRPSHRPPPRQDRSWSITSVDHSLAMLRRQKSRLSAVAGDDAADDAVRFVHIDALNYVPEAQAYDVIVTPFFLDCFSHADLADHMPIWLSGLGDDGMYLHVDFILPKSPWQRPRAHLLLWAMHAFFRWQTGLTNRQLVDPQEIIQHSGLYKVAEQTSGRGMIAAQLWRCDSARC